MFEAVSAVLERTIDEIEIPASRAALTRCFSLLDRFSAKITAAVAAFDEAELWRDDGATSTTGWLRQHAGQSGREARRWARVARRLATLPVTARAYAEGTLSGGHVQAIVANLSDETAPLFAAAEGELVSRLARLGVKDAGNVMQAWAAAARDHLQPDPGDGDDHEPGGPERSLHLSETLDGRDELCASLDPEGRALPRPRCGWPSHPMRTASPRAHRAAGERTRCWTSASSSSTTRPAAPVAATGPTSTSSSTTRT